MFAPLKPLTKSAAGSRIWLMVTLITVVCFAWEGQAQEEIDILESLAPSLVITDPDSVPPPMPIVDEGEYDIVHILLLGSDTANPLNAGRTDVMVILSVNRTANTVSMLSLPRDLYVYIPGERVYRLNSAYGFGEQRDIGGAALLKQTIAYNLGLTIDHYARVDFSDFRAIVDALGGIDIAVDCTIEDWRLTTPDLDPTIEANWEMFTLPVGVHMMDGDLALWYARSRRTTSDFDRGRRHQALLRALWRRINDLGLTGQVAELWTQVVGAVETDMSLQDMISLLPVAAALDSAHIRSYTLRPNHEVRSWLSPEGSSVLLPERAALQRLEETMMQPPSQRQFVSESPRVLIVNASGFGALSRVAADRLAWEGFAPIIADESAPYQDRTTMTDYTGRTKGSSLSLLQRALRIDEGRTTLEPMAEREVDFRIVLGGQYSACTYG